MTDWVPDRLLRFTIAAETDSIPVSTLDPHVTIGGPYFDVLSGRYDIRPGPNGRVTLELTSELRVSTRFNLYATPWSDAIMRSIQENILEVIRARAEARVSVGAAHPTGESAGLCRFDTAAFRDTVTFTYYLTASLMLRQSSKAVTATAPYLAAISSTFQTPHRITLGSWTGTLGDSDEPCDHDYWCKVGAWGGEAELKVDGKGRVRRVEWQIRPDAPEAVAAVEASIREADSLKLIPPAPRIPGLSRGSVRIGLELTDSAPSGGVPLWRFQLPYIRITDPVGIIEQPRPKWPEGLGLRPGGSVILQFIVSENGHVARESIRVLEADANPFIAPSIEAILSSRFRPAQAGSCPVKMLVRQRVRYRS